ncbi:C45 family autoproteolytic acyltransferase/hydolase [Pseudorhodobacter sp.]|uniref:C45 family autoproteolytic acyltransferase/hydolase n=1 Tax=Pseudorhodobacter sp. TaxID=1934400 RepID=UPI0039E292C5
MTVLSLSGTAHARGLAQANGADAAQIRRATVGRVELARADGLFDSAALAYLAAQRDFMQAADPAGMAELAGIAEGFGLSEPDLFQHLHLGTLRDIKGGAAMIDGCSAWAVASGPDGPMVVKNRDFSGQHLGIQRVARHAGPDVKTGAMLCLGSLGSPGAYSSGMNAAGLALADTQVPVATHRVGWLRYFLMTRILADCGSVAQAVAFIKRIPHAGGGTLILADRSGDTAAVELGAAGPQITTGGTVWRTNHYVSDALAADTLKPKGDVIASNSPDRFACLSARLPKQVWSVTDAKRLMATHPDDGPDAAPICQHGEGDGTMTISSAVYSCKLGGMDICTANPCSGNWTRLSLVA